MKGKSKWIMSFCLFIILTVFFTVNLWAQKGRIYLPEEHWMYSGHFKITGRVCFMVGNLHDTPPWDHVDNEGKNIHKIEGQIDIDVNERTNKGTCVVTTKLPEGNLKVVFTRFDPWGDYQDGGIATRIFEHGDSGNGDTLYPKTFLYLAGWGYADVYLKDKLLYKDHQSHFMVMEGSRDPKTMATNYPRPMDAPKGLPAGDVDPARMEIDLYVRSPKPCTESPCKDNNPPREVFIHLMWMEVTWRH